MSSGPVMLDPVTHPCQGSYYHYPKSIGVNEDHHVLPVEWQKQIWPDATREHPHIAIMAALCGNCHNNVHYLLNLLKAGKPITGIKNIPPWTSKIVKQGWDLWVANVPPSP
jgi:hypothetical protein